MSALRKLRAMKKSSSIGVAVSAEEVDEPTTPHISFDVLETADT